MFLYSYLLSRHLDYLCPELVTLSLFDNDVGVAEKVAMSRALRYHPKPTRFDMGKPGHPAYNAQRAKLAARKMSLSVFFTECSWLMLHLIEADTAWLLAP